MCIKVLYACFYKINYMHQIEKSIDRLEELCSVIPGLLKEISEETFNYSSVPSKWSKKQILGHLVDSAANNHQRFVRLQYEREPVIFYDQNEWNRVQRYEKKDSEQLRQLWLLYNLHLLHIIKNILPENLENKGFSKDGNSYTLSWYIQDYVIHLEHHLHQLVAY